MPVDSKSVRKEKRKYHHKSRNGCSQCKQRHIKVKIVPGPQKKPNLRTTVKYECSFLTLVCSAMRGNLAAITVFSQIAPAVSWG